MNFKSISAIIIIVAGVIMLSYGSFTFTKKTHKADLGGITLAVEEKQKVNIPMWAGIATVVIGGAIFLFPIKKS